MHSFAIARHPGAVLVALFPMLLVMMAILAIERLVAIAIAVAASAAASAPPPAAALAVFTVLAAFAVGTRHSFALSLANVFVVLRRVRPGVAYCNRLADLYDR